MNNSLAEVRPELVPEWSEKNLPLKPDEITFGSNKKVWWRGACGHECLALNKDKNEPYYLSFLIKNSLVNNTFCKQVELNSILNSIPNIFNSNSGVLRKRNCKYNKHCIYLKRKGLKKNVLKMQKLLSHIRGTILMMILVLKMKILTEKKLQEANNGELLCQI